MNSTAVVKGIGAGFAGVVAVLALSAPAYASPDPGPGYPGSVSGDGAGVAAGIGRSPVVDDSWEVLQVATGALAGLGVAAAGFAAVEITRRHGHHPHGHAVG